MYVLECIFIITMGCDFEILSKASSLMEANRNQSRFSICIPKERPRVKNIVQFDTSNVSIGDLLKFH